MYAALKAVVLCVYAVAAASLALPVPADLARALQIAAIALLLVHVIEIPLFRRQIGLYRGPFAVSIFLTLLFGLLHWKPLVDAAARAPKP
jgi:uncharacterized protein YhhL (DUF1145 family)